MNLQNGFTAPDPAVPPDPAVETARPKKCRVQGISDGWWLPGSQHPWNHQTIHLCQKLVQGLFPFIVAAHLAVTFLTNGIDLINEYDTGRFFLCLLERSRTLAAHAYKHLHKFRTGNGEKGNLRLTSNSFCQQGLTCSRRAYKKGSFGHRGTNLPIFLRIMEEIYDLLQKLPLPHPHLLHLNI